MVEDSTNPFAYELETDQLEASAEDRIHHRWLVESLRQ